MEMFGIPTCWNIGNELNIGISLNKYFYSYTDVSESE